MYELVSFVARGKVRRLVLENLSEPRTPTNLASILKKERSTVSRSILDLEKKGLIKCLTPKERMARFYQLSQEGLKILNEIKKIEI